jgi:hypothetical protein
MLRAHVRLSVRANSDSGAGALCPRLWRTECRQRERDDRSRFISGETDRTAPGPGTNDSAQLRRDDARPVVVQRVRRAAGTKESGEQRSGTGRGLK